MLRRTRLLGLVCLAVALASLAVAHRMSAQPVLSVRVTGELRHTPREALEAAVADHVDGSMLEVDVAAVRAAAMRLPWVEDVSVRRVWPESLHIRVLEREPVARWGAGGLLEVSGALFHPEDASAFSSLPLLEGPSGTPIEMLERYWTIESLLRPLGRRVSRLTLSERHSWRAELDNGLVLVLGQGSSAERLERFVRAFETVLAGRLQGIERVDLRYANGFTVRWRNPPGEGEGQG